MARLIRDGAVKGGKSEAVKDAQRKPPSKSVLIHGKDFVQIIAKVTLWAHCFWNPSVSIVQIAILTRILCTQS